MSQAPTPAKKHSTDTYTDNGKNFYTVRDADEKDIAARDKADEDRAKAEAEKRKKEADAAAKLHPASVEPSKDVVIKDTKGGAETVISRHAFVSSFRLEAEPK